MTIILDNYPLPPSRGSDQGAVRIQELLSERIIVISVPPKIEVYHVKLRCFANYFALGWDREGSRSLTPSLSRELVFWALPPGTPKESKKSPAGYPGASLGGTPKGSYGNTAF